MPKPLAFNYADYERVCKERDALYKVIRKVGGTLCSYCKHRDSMKKCAEKKWRNPFWEHSVCEEDCPCAGCRPAFASKQFEVRVDEDSNGGKPDK